MLTATKDVGKGFVLVTMSATVVLVSDSVWYGSYHQSIRVAMGIDLTTKYKGS
jgi:hypothetical protein